MTQETTDPIQGSSVDPNGTVFFPGAHRVVAPNTNTNSAAKDHKGHKETPDPTGSPLRSLRSFAAIQPSTSVSLQNPNPWSARIGITVPLEKLRDLLPK